MNNLYDWIVYLLGEPATMDFSFIYYIVAVVILVISVAILFSLFIGMVLAIFKR